MMNKRGINTKFDDHDFEQIDLLAKINKVTRTEIIRKIVKAYLDSAKPKIREASS